MIDSYPKVYALTHKALDGLWNGSVKIQEKIDGSQISFQLTENGLAIRSRRAEIDQENAGMFSAAVQALNERKGRMTPGWIYRGEYLAKPRHNTLAYRRVPNGHVMIFDIDMGGGQNYAPASTLSSLVAELDLEAVPFLASYSGPSGIPADMGWLEEFLGLESVLGGPKVEGIVIKNYKIFGPDSKILVAKLVNRAFKEAHSEAWRSKNPSQSDFVLELADRYRTEARWRKAIQHLAEQGELQFAPQDIPALLRELGTDAHEELRDEIADALFAHFWKRVISRRIIKGFPEWYKEYLRSEVYGG